MNSLPSLLALLNPILTAPETAPCPRCGAQSPRNEVRQLSRWAGSLESPRREELSVGCYICPVCPTGECWFRLEPPGFEGRSDYTTSTRLSVLSLVIDHKLSFDGAAAVGRSLLHLPKLTGTTVMRWYRNAGETADTRAHIERMSAIFSGQLAIDEVYDGGFYVIKVTDPLNGVEVGSWMGKGSPNKKDVRKVLLELKEAGFNPLLVVTDGSNLYPEVIRDVWPDAEHQRCVFHFLMGSNRKLMRAFWTAYNALPKPKKRRAGRPKKRGRPRQDKQKRENRRKVRSCRYLFFKRGGVDEKGRPRISEEEQKQLDEAIRLCPALAELRRFIEALYELFGPTTDSHELAGERRQAIVEDAEFQKNPGFAKVLADLANEDLYKRLTRYLDFDNADKTSNHPERENREFRKRQRSHYRLRSRRSFVAFLDVHATRQKSPSHPRQLSRRKPMEAPTEEVLAA